jgi:hypothetical protein
MLPLIGMRVRFSKDIRPGSGMHPIGGSCPAAKMKLVSRFCRSCVRILRPGVWVC